MCTPFGAGARWEEGGGHTGAAGTRGEIDVDERSHTGSVRDGGGVKWVWSEHTGHVTH